MSYTLRALGAQFLKLLKPDGSAQMDVPFVEADGVMFRCPKCLANNRGDRRGVCIL